MQKDKNVENKSLPCELAQNELDQYLNFLLQSDVEVIITLRKKCNQSIRGAAEIVGLDNSTLCKYESKKRKMTQNTYKKTLSAYLSYMALNQISIPDSIPEYCRLENYQTRKEEKK